MRAVRRPLAILVMLALALPFAAAFGAVKAPCCCKGSMTCALKQKASCATSCSMGAAQSSESVSLPDGASRHAMTPFALIAPDFAAYDQLAPAFIFNASRPLPPDPPPPRA